MSFYFNSQTARTKKYSKQEMEITVNVGSHSSIEHERTCLLSERIESIAVQRRGKDNVGASRAAEILKIVQMERSRM